MNRIELQTELREQRSISENRDCFHQFERDAAHDRVLQIEDELNSDDTGMWELVHHI